MTDETLQPTQPTTLTPAAFAPSQPAETRSGPRKRTAGEIAFDLSAYGGFSLIGNEVLSTSIMKRVMNPDSRLNKAFTATDNFLQKVPLVNKLSYVKPGPDGFGRAAFILWACIGGFFLVLPVKWMEDNKGKLVRTFDRMFHGDKTETPEMKEAHEEMDRAPKQTWRSLGEGRIVTVLSALVVDWAMGWVHGPLGKAADKFNVLKDVAGFDRLAATSARHTILGVDKVRSMFGMKVDTKRNAAIRDVLKNVHDLDKRYKIHPQEGKAASWLSIGGSLLTLSATLTLLFYASSKMFASGQEKKRERKLAAKEGRPPSAYADMGEEEAPTTETKPEESKKAPSTRVANVENFSRVADNPSIELGGA